MIPIAHAQSYSGAKLQALDLVDKVNQVILFPLIGLLMAIAFLVFLWGAFEYVKNSDSESGRETGRNHLLYGTIGMLVMLSAWAILNIAAGTFGIGGELRDSTRKGLSPFAPESSVRPSSRPDRFDDGTPLRVSPLTPYGDTGVGTTPSIGGADPSVTGGDPSYLSAPDLDPSVEPSNLLNPNPSDGSPSVDTTSADPRYPVIETREDGSKVIDCGDDGTCLNAIQSCWNDHSGTYSGSRFGSDYIICQP